MSINQVAIVVHENEQAIKERAKRLSSKAAQIWSTPALDEETLQEYKEVGKSVVKEGDVLEIIRMVAGG